MALRKPIPGQDNGTWGNILNDFLDVSHVATGELKADVVSDSHVIAGANIAESKLNLASDAAPNVASRRTLGVGANQAMAGNDSRVTGAEQTARKNQASGYAGLDALGALSVLNRVIQVGPVNYGYVPSLAGGGPNSAYVLIDKSNTASDASVVLRDQGAVRGEIGLAGDNNIHFKTATGVAGSESFVDRLIINTAGDAWFTSKLGVGTVAVETAHIASLSAGARTVTKVENTNAGGGSSGAAVQLAGTGLNWTLGTDAGLNGGNNLFIQDNNAGYPPRVLIDTNGNVAVGKDNASYKLDVVGDIASSVAGSGFRVKEGANAKMGIATLVGGTVTVSTTAVANTSRVFLTIQAPSGTVGTTYVSSRIASTSFTITSTSGTDTSAVAWLIVDPS